jgi:hypothetical protein
MWNHLRYTVDGVRPIIYITENGCDVPKENEMTLAVALEDTFRIDYYRLYLAELERAIGDGVDIRGYFAWSLMDNFEWADGFKNRFGLYYIDYTDSSLPRYPKSSSFWYTQYVKDHVSYGSNALVPDETSSNLRKKPPGKGGKGDTDKNKDKGGHSSGSKGGGPGDNKGPVRPTDDDYTQHPDGGVENVNSPQYRQRKRMEAVTIYGGWMDYLNAALGSNHGASTFGPEGMLS